MSNRSTEEQSLQMLRHGSKHHLDAHVRGSDVVIQQPFPCHAGSAVAVKPGAEFQL